jgi:hypothetical protein
MTSAGSGIVHEVVELLRSFGRLGVPDGFEGIVVEVLYAKNLAIAAEKALIFLEREHHDAGNPVPLDTNRVKHRLIGIISKLARNLLGRDRQQRFSHILLLDLAVPKRAAALLEVAKSPIIPILRKVKRRMICHPSGAPE